MHRIEVHRTSGLPCVSIPHDLTWSLVEYLAFRRVQADFSYFEERFLAVFPHISATAAQQILDDWEHYDQESTKAPRAEGSTDETGPMAMGQVSARSHWNA